MSSKHRVKFENFFFFDFDALLLSSKTFPALTKIFCAVIFDGICHPDLLVRQNLSHFECGVGMFSIMQMTFFLSTL